jgi:hypothetical protein
MRSSREVAPGSGVSHIETDREELTHWIVDCINAAVDGAEFAVPRQEGAILKSWQRNLAEERDGKWHRVAIGETPAVPRIGETVGVFGELVEGSTTIRQFRCYVVKDICHYLYNEKSLGSDKSEIPPKEISLFVTATDQQF